ncbi:MAG: sigma-70 family RNA polymerase sigma factor [Caldilineaceae bacterium]|nr:sigma-70 family RNA polymerase sigma factor [Caldilineaceae bacterium]
MAMPDSISRAGYHQSDWYGAWGGSTAQVATMTSDFGNRTDLRSMVNAARLGDDWAFSRLVEAYHSSTERVAFHILHTEEAAADAVQDAWIKVHQAISRFEDGNFRAWLLRIVTNTCYDHLRRQKRRPSVSLDEMLEASNIEFADDEQQTDPEQAVLHREQRDLLMNAIEDLSPWHRQVVILVDVQGYDYSEAADLLDVPLGTVKSRLSRARAVLRDRLVEMNLLPASPKVMGEA